MAYHRSFYGLGYVTAIGSGATPTPYTVAVVRSASVDWKTTEKELRGNSLFALDVATSTASITGKIQMADFDAALVGLVIAGTSTATGQTKATTHPTTTIPGTPFEITVTNSATYVTDLGVVNLTNGTRMTRGATATGTGVYACAAGVYTFNTADAGDSVAISYTYTGTGGITVTGSNPASGATSGYALRLFDPSGGTRENGILFPAVKFTSLSLGMKYDDWSETAMDFTAYADANGVPFYTYGNE